MKRIVVALLLLALLGVAGWLTRRPCGEDASEPVVQQPVVNSHGVMSPIDFSSLQQSPPPWAKVIPQQIAEAEKHGVPVAFENDIGMRFVLIPAGTFLMGSPEDEEGRDYEETRHRVKLTRPFYVQTTEVTDAEYRRWKKDHDRGAVKEHSSNGANQPVVMVGWDDAVGYAKWLSGRDGKRTYRLPTEAEWEYACRAGTATAYNWGDAASEGSWDANADDPVNAWGLRDVHGSVWEWCQDWYGTYPTGRVTDPRGPASGDYRVLRGGSRDNGSRGVRSADRDWLPPDGRYTSLGFRLVLLLPR